MTTPERILHGNYAAFGEFLLSGNEIKNLRQDKGEDMSLSPPLPPLR
jgi:hypothetical protein